MSSAYDAASIVWPLALMLFADQQSQSPYRAQRQPDTPKGFLLIAPRCASPLTSSHAHSGQFGVSCCRRLQLRGASMFGVVAIIPRHDGPGRAGHLVGKGHRHQLEGFPGEEVSGPIGQRRLGFARLDAVEGGVRSHHERRRSRLPILEILPSFALPPVECWRGTRPIQAANSRPPANICGSLTVAVSTVAVNVPMPGTVARRWLVSLARCCLRISTFKALISASSPDRLATNGRSAARISGGS
jgi:hypothetical protein